VETTPPKPHRDDVFAERFLADAHHVLAQALRSGQLTVEQLHFQLRGSPADLRAQGLTVAVHNDYRQDGEDRTFWLMTYARPGHPTCAYKGEGKSDAEALDQIRAMFARDTDKLHHAPLCRANHFHGTRAPTGPCTCGAAVDGRIPAK